MLSTISCGLKPHLIEAYSLRLVAYSWGEAPLLNQFVGSGICKCDRANLKDINIRFLKSIYPFTLVKLFFNRANIKEYAIASLSTVNSFFVGFKVICF